MNKKISDFENLNQNLKFENKKLLQSLEIKLERHNIRKELVLENSDSKLKLKNLIEERKELEEQIKSFETDLAKMADVYDNKEVQIEDLKNENENLEKIILDKEEGKGELRNMIQLLESEIEQVKEQNQTYQIELENFYEKAENLEELANEQLIQKQKELEQREIEINQDFEEFESEKDNLFERLEFSEKRTQELEKIIIRERSLREEREKEIEKLQKIKEINEKLIKDNSKLEGELKGKEDIITMFSGEKANRNEENEELAREIRLENRILTRELKSMPHTENKLETRSAVLPRYGEKFQGVNYNKLYNENAQMIKNMIEGCRDRFKKDFYMDSTLRSSLQKNSIKWEQVLGEENTKPKMKAKNFARRTTDKKKVRAQRSRSKSAKSKKSKENLKKKKNLRLVLGWR